MAQGKKSCLLCAVSGPWSLARPRQLVRLHDGPARGNEREGRKNGISHAALFIVKFPCGVSRFVKSGFAGGNFPTAIFPSMIGRPVLRYEERGQTSEIKDIMVLSWPHANESVGALFVCVLASSLCALVSCAALPLKSGWR